MKYYIDPDGEGVITREDAQNEINTNDWVKKWSGNSAEAFLLDCTLIGEFETRGEACQQALQLLYS